MMGGKKANPQTIASRWMTIGSISTPSSSRSCREFGVAAFALLGAVNTVPPLCGSATAEWLEIQKKVHRSTLRRKPREAACSENAITGTALSALAECFRIVWVVG